MLVDNNSIDTRRFREEFSRRFKNFCNKAPLLLSFTIYDNGANIYMYKGKSTSQSNQDYESERIYDYAFQYDQSVKQNIANIKNFLRENYYPIMQQTMLNEYDYSASELNRMVEKGEIGISEIGEIKKTAEKTKLYRIDKIISERDEIFITDLDTDELYQYQMKSPVFLFVKMFYETDETPSPEKMWSLFEGRSFLMRRLDKLNFNKYEE